MLGIGAVMVLFYDYRNPLFGGMHISKFVVTSLVKIINSKKTKNSLAYIDAAIPDLTAASYVASFCGNYPTYSTK